MRIISTCSGMIPTHFDGLPRSRFLQALHAEGIPCSGGYSPLYQEPFLKNTLESRAFQAVYSPKRIADYLERIHCPANDRLCETAVWLFQTTAPRPAVRHGPDRRGRAQGLRPVRKTRQSLTAAVREGPGPVLQPPGIDDRPKYTVPCSWPTCRHPACMHGLVAMRVISSELGKHRRKDRRRSDAREIAGLRNRARWYIQDRRHPPG